MPSARGFTLLEVIIALALATALTAAVYSATRSMTNTARRQKEAGKQDRRWNRFLEILRADLRGWVSVTAKSGQPGRPSGPGREPNKSKSEIKQAGVLIAFMSTRDALAEPAVSDRAFLRRSTLQITYRLKKSRNGFEVIREERHHGDRIVSLRILEVPQSPVFEFRYGDKWKATQKKDQRPLAVRLKTKHGSCCILL